MRSWRWARSTAPEPDSCFRYGVCMHTRTHFGRAASLSITSIIAALVIMAPVTSSAQTTKASRNGFGYGFQVQLWHYDPVARSNVIGDVSQAGFNWMKQQ